jgi:hypothetical protein
MHQHVPVRQRQGRSRLRKDALLGTMTDGGMSARIQDVVSVRAAFPYGALA